MSNLIKELSSARQKHDVSTGPKSRANYILDPQKQKKKKNTEDNIGSKKNSKLKNKHKRIVHGLSRSRIRDQAQDIRLCFRTLKPVSHRIWRQDDHSTYVKS